MIINVPWCEIEKVGRIGLNTAINVTYISHYNAMRLIINMSRIIEWKYIQSDKS